MREDRFEGFNIPSPGAAAVGGSDNRSRAVCCRSRRGTICYRSRRRPSASAGAATQVRRDVGARLSSRLRIANVEAVHVELVRHVHAWIEKRFWCESGFK